MGSLQGHLVPGSFFLAFSLWWMFKVLVRYHVCWRAARDPDARGRSLYQNTSTFPSSCCPQIPVEGFMKIVFVITGMIGELATAFRGGKFVKFGNTQHMTMYFFFGLNGVVDVMTHYQPSVPAGLDYLSAALAVAVEGMLFFHHLHDRTPMDVQVHMLLVYVVCLCVVSLLLEMYFRTSVLAALSRTYFFIIQGTWLCQVGFLLYPPFGQPWDQNSPHKMTLVTIIFCAHLAFVFLMMLVTGCVVQARVSALSVTDVYHRLHPVTHAHRSHPHLTKLDAEQVRQIIEDSDEEDV